MAQPCDSNHKSRQEKKDTVQEHKELCVRGKAIRYGDFTCSSSNTTAKLQEHRSLRYGAEARNGVQGRKGAFTML